MNSAATGIGVALWVLFTAVPIVLLVTTVLRFTAFPRRPCFWQPIQGIRATEGHQPTLLLPILLQSLLIIGAAASAALFPWVEYPSADDYPKQVDGSSDSPIETLIKTGSRVVAYYYATLSVTSGIYQITFMFMYQAKCADVLACWNSSPSVVTPKLWARQYLLFSLQCSSILMIGLVSDVCGGGVTTLSFYLFVITTCISPVQLFFLKRYMEALPGPHIGGAPGYPQCPLNTEDNASAVAWARPPVVIEAHQVAQVAAYRMGDDVLVAESILPPPRLPPPQPPAQEHLPPTRLGTYVYPAPDSASVVVHVRSERQIEMQHPSSPSNQICK